MCVTRGTWLHLYIHYNSCYVQLMEPCIHLLRKSIIGNLLANIIWHPLFRILEKSSKSRFNLTRFMFAVQNTAHASLPVPGYALKMPNSLEQSCRYSSGFREWFLHHSTKRFRFLWALTALNSIKHGQARSSLWTLQEYFLWLPLGSRWNFKVKI